MGGTIDLLVVVPEPGSGSRDIAVLEDGRCQLCCRDRWC
jgi:hypothetical protein